MVREQTTDLHVNTRKTDVFDIFNFKYYIGPNPYLDTAAIVFDFALTEHQDPLPMEDYVHTISDFYPQLAEQTYELYADLFARVVSEVNKLDISLYFNLYSINSYDSYVKIAIQALHEHTAKSVVYLVWDWFENISKERYFPLEERLIKLQDQFRKSVYGGPTVYALWQTAYQQGIPTFYLWEEGLMQYGYGKKQLRGIGTTFDVDSHLDSEFTTRKDDCKEFLNRLGFPVPKGDIVTSERQALAVAQEIGYPVVIKPVSGHKGIGVTPNIRDSRKLKSAYELAVSAIPKDLSVRVIVEESIWGKDFRLLCVNGKFVAATERRPPSIVGDGYSTIEELIARENNQPQRRDTPTSSMSKIVIDRAMERYLYGQRLDLDSVIEKNRIIYLSDVANISSGGVSINATDKIHPDNIILAEEIAQNFRLTCLGIDVIAKNIAHSWRYGNFAVLEINAAPGIFMHVNPVIGKSVDVPHYILSQFFPSAEDARIPIITFNRITKMALLHTIAYLLSEYPKLKIGGVSREGSFLNLAQRFFHEDYNRNVQSLLRHPQLDLFIAEYSGDILESMGMVYKGSNIVVLDHPTAAEMVLLRDAIDGSIVITRQKQNVSIRHKGVVQHLIVRSDVEFCNLYLERISQFILMSLDVCYPPT
ncbi:cyanophycin synthetase [Cylindrospermopsis raciborskii S07]|uniref:Cyanophycin synthetase n=3 Tax=Cylindrospermopsis raciborskii TaxID=77022 RepID=A0A853M7Y4_9CYAN|nr:acetate--CoA ligase family protein [Cylindrospermopsis raciborskii]EFA69854.1 cyanophycin synthetase [Cylindrospermopsis raciborskii CS-505]MBA4445673.1 acetate--CoA ligase family protein [Cylindrospermopsis raciborskii CS-506_C]MBA4449904.1 acetate--CoA ligase family protein [Cylindrospermopsis raciborskii CS-506_D]MBA4456519.1 acetate--CoA ligase family protein [Cylindrospermopsis raciborskii CS-506_B]MBA4465876.1 acetate--CoA ligase family protein [Cylindrospermopsis raciborskii CS-506_A